MIENFQISNPECWNQINNAFSESGGIYRLYCVNEQKQTIVTNRILKIDTKGTLYIGKAIKFLDRVITLKKSLSPEHISSNHECGARYKKSELFQQTFPYNNLWIELINTENIDETEKKLLSDYEIEFGELPPLNRNK